MRLGGPTFNKPDSPDAWIGGVKACGYRAAYCPVKPDASPDIVKAYADAAKRADIVIAEVGAWSNPLSPDKAAASAALDQCKKALALADAMGARCCVNIAGSRGMKWDGPDASDLTPETLDMIVAIVRDIVDAVKPSRSFYTLEPMPWMYPDSPDNYLLLIKAIDRKQFGVHLDPVNLICSPQRYFSNTDLIKDCFAKLGKHIRSCHAKDVLMGEQLTVHIDEVRPGLGKLDYRTYLREASRLEPDLPIMLEHLKSEDEYSLAAKYVRSVAREEGLRL